MLISSTSVILQFNVVRIVIDTQISIPNVNSRRCFRN